MLSHIMIWWKLHITYHSNVLISGLATRIFQVFGRAEKLQGCSALCLRCAEGGADAADAQSSVANRRFVPRPPRRRPSHRRGGNGRKCLLPLAGCPSLGCGHFDGKIDKERWYKYKTLLKDCHMSHMSQFTILQHFNFCFCFLAVFVALLRFVEGLVFIYHKFRALDMSFPHKLRWNFEVLIFARQPGTVTTPTSRTFGMAGD